MQKKCLRITFSIDERQGIYFSDVIQENARTLEIEGTVQTIAAEQKMKVVVCGEKKNIDKFLDVLHKEALEENITDIEVEPFLKEKDYRGVFRIIK